MGFDSLRVYHFFIATSIACKNNNASNMKIKKFSLFKRGKKWSAKTSKQGTVYTVSTGTSNKSDAWEIAPRKLALKIQEDRARGCSVRSAVNHYLDYNQDSRPKTKQGVVGFVKNYLQTIGLDWETQASEAFSKRSAIEFQQRRLRGISSSDRDRIARSTNSILRSVKSIYSERILDTYKTIPEHVSDFKRVRSVRCGTVQYTVVDKRESIRQAIERCEKLKDTSPGAYISYYLSLHAGLRRGEVAAAKWDWLTPQGILIQNDGDFQTKSGRSRLVPLSASQIEHLRTFQGTSDYIVPGAYTSRYRVYPDEVARIIRECGIGGSKSFHELRKYYGANVATQLGIFHAQKYLGHHSPDLTSKYYADIIDAKPVEIKILA